MHASQPVRILVNECVELPVTALLRASGFDVVTILDYCQPGADDRTVLQTASDLGRILLTYDRQGRDFGALDAHHSGLAIVNCRVTNFSVLARIIVQSFMAVQISPGNIYVMEPSRVRVHKSDGSSELLLVSNI